MPTPTTTTQETRPRSLRTTIPQDDLQAHIEDSLIVNRIIHGRLVPVRWNDLDEAERRSAYNTTFAPNY